MRSWRACRPSWQASRAPARAAGHRREPSAGQSIARGREPGADRIRPPAPLPAPAPTPPSRPPRRRRWRIPPLRSSRRRRRRRTWRIARADQARLPSRPASGPSIFDTLASYWWAIALLVVAVLAYFGLRVSRSRRQSDLDDSLGRLAAAGGTSSPYTRLEPSAGDTASMRGAAAQDDAFVVEESGSHERPRIPSAAAPVAAKHIATPIRRSAARRRSTWIRAIRSPRPISTWPMACTIRPRI